MTTDNNNRSQNRKSLALELLGSGKTDMARAQLADLCLSHPDDTELLFALGVADGMLGHYAAAENSLRRAAFMAPDQAIVHYNLGKALKAQDKFEQAVGSFTTACRLEQGNAAFHNDLSNALTMLGRHREALAHIQQATSLNPGTPNYHYNQGNILTYLGLNDQAVVAYRLAVALQPDFRAARIAHGDALLGMGLLDDALSVYELILQENPADPGALVGKAAVMDKRGQFNEARELLAPVLATGRIDAFATATFAGFSHHIGREGEALRLALQLLEDPRLRASERARLCFSLGHIHDRNGRFEEAFHYYTEGNGLRRSNFDSHAHRKYVDQIIATFSPAYMSHAERARNTSEIPVFIVGMPRSGTSLVEQILASHPQVHGAGELELLASVADSIPERTGKTGNFSQAVHALTADITNELAAAYLDQLTAHDPTARRITDKLPANFMLLGLVEILFPSARIIHCKRNPLDTCLSCFFQDFAGNHPYSGNLASLGEYYLEYQRIMAHWRTLLRIPVYDIQYEELVANAESVTPDLIKFCGLEWDDACLDFHMSQRTVATASYDQVRRPLYTSSMARWRHYEGYIGELINTLGIQPGTG
jgi:tetratricopeptide (TPR) repeat protein